PAAPTADGDGPALLGRAVQAVEELAEFSAGGAARDRGAVAPSGFRRYWAGKSRHRRGRPAIGTEVRDLIRRMSHANPLWGAPRIHGELLKLGLTVSQATWQNAYAERVIGSIRRECLDHIVVLGERHLRGILS